MAIWGPYHGDATTKEVNMTVCMTASLKVSGELLFVCAAACPDSFLWGKSAYVPLAFLLLNANWFAGSPLSYAVPSIPSATEIWLAWVSEYTQNTPQPAIWNSTRPQLVHLLDYSANQKVLIERKLQSMLQRFCIAQWERCIRLMLKKTDKDEPSLRNESPLLAGSSLRRNSPLPEFILKRCKNVLVIQRILPAVLQQIRAQEARWQCVILRSSTMWAAQWGRQHSTPLPSAEILILRAAEHNAIDFLFELQRHASLSDTAAARLLSLAPSQFLTSEAVERFSFAPAAPPRLLALPLRTNTPFPPACDCCCSTHCLPQTGGSPQSVAQTHSHRWADVPVGACVADKLRTMAAVTVRLKDFAKYTAYHQCWRHAVARLCASGFSFVFYAKSVPAVNLPCADFYYDQGQCWFNHTLATTASHDDPPDHALRSTRVPWEGGGGVECDSQYFE